MSQVVYGDCREVELGLHQAIVTDPPFEEDFGAGYHEQTWDNGPDEATWRRLLEAVEPGRFAAVCASPMKFHRAICRMEDAGWVYHDLAIWLFGQGMPKNKQSRLKPAWMPVILTRRPGKPVINIEGVRHESTDGKFRHPANVLLDEAAAAELDKQSGVLKSGSRKAGVRKGIGYHGTGTAGDGGPALEKSEGGASRFMYIAKVRGKERQHQTEKPVDLMRWLIRLVSFPGESVLDPFAGSCSALRAADMEDRRGFGIELNEPQQGE